MELSQYTDEQLIAELKKRQLVKVSHKVEDEKRKPYIFWQAIVTRVYTKAWGSISDRFIFIVESDGCQYNATLLGNVGFNQKNMPKIGDKVLLRYKNGFGYTCNKEHSKIIEIIKD